VHATAEHGDLPQSPPREVSAPPASVGSFRAVAGRLALCSCTHLRSRRRRAEARIPIAVATSSHRLAPGPPANERSGDSAPLPRPAVADRRPAASVLRQCRSPVRASIARWSPVGPPGTVPLIAVPTTETGHVGEQGPSVLRRPPVDYHDSTNGVPVPGVDPVPHQWKAAIRAAGRRSAQAAWSFQADRDLVYHYERAQETRSQSPPRRR